MGKFDLQKGRDGQKRNVLINRQTGRQAYKQSMINCLRQMKRRSDLYKDGQMDG